jgi:lysophospholipase L1-like esterase
VMTEAEHREAIADADLTIVMIGWNDWQGPCVWDGLEDCLVSGSATVEANLTAILDEILLLRDGQPTALRVVTYFDPYIGFPDLPELGGFSPDELDDFEAAFSQALVAFNGMLCGIAEAHDAECVDTYTAMNGPDHASEAEAAPTDGAFLAEDHVHLSAAGHELIAQAIADLGYAPLG